MFQNPLVQTILLLIGAYSALTMTAKYSPADKILLALALVFCIVIWMSRYSRGKLQELHRQPGLGSVIDLVCQIAKEPPVSGAARAAAASRQSGGYAPAVGPQGGGSSQPVSN